MVVRQRLIRRRVCVSLDSLAHIPMGQIWRLHLRPYGGKGDPALAVALCLKESVLGMGWGVDVGTSESLGWEQYEERSKASGL